MSSKPKCWSIWFSIESIRKKRIIQQYSRSKKISPFTPKTFLFVIKLYYCEVHICGDYDERFTYSSREPEYVLKI